MHGGLSPDLQSMEQIRRVMRPTDVPDTGEFEAWMADRRGGYQREGNPEDERAAKGIGKMGTRSKRDWGEGATRTGQAELCDRGKG